MGSAVVFIRGPIWSIRCVRLVTPSGPFLPRASCEKLQVRGSRAGFDNRIQLIGLARMFAFARADQINLPTPRRERPRVLPPHSKQHQLGHIAEVKSRASTIRAAVFAHLVPNDIRFVAEAPRR